MDRYDPKQSFDADSARRHDTRGDEEDAVAFLSKRAGSGPVLELAIGTGRLALPLAETGARVDGIDVAPAMIERLREKPGGDALEVTLGNFADVDVPGRYALVFVAWNSFFNLLSQEEQVRCFANVAAHLEDGGSFAIEAYTPRFLYELRGDGRVAPEAIETDSVRISVLRHDAATQTLEQSHVSIGSAGIGLTPVVQRYVWPSELDLMARLAGLRLVERYADWREAPFRSDSEAHVSVYAR